MRQDRAACIVVCALAPVRILTTGRTVLYHCYRYHMARVRPLSTAGRPFRGRRSRSRTEAAFTLIELLVVCVIVGILAVIVLSKIQRAVVQARAAQSISNGKSILAAIHIYAASDEAVERGELPIFATGVFGPACGTAALFDQWNGGGGPVLCDELKAYIKRLPENTVNVPPLHGADMLWTSAAKNGSGDPTAACKDQYPSGLDGGFFYSRRYDLLMLNSRELFLDSDKKYYELGQPFATNGASKDEGCEGDPRFTGPIY